MAHGDMEELKIGSRGRAVNPAAMRKALGLEQCEVLLGHIEDGRLVLERRGSVLKQLQSRFANVARGVSLADELVAERREETRRKAEGD